MKASCRMATKVLYQVQLAKVNEARAALPHYAPMGDGDPITDEDEARQALAELFGRPAQSFAVEPEDTAFGVWLVSLPRDVSAELRRTGWYYATGGDYAVESEWPE